MKIFNYKFNKTIIGLKTFFPIILIFLLSSCGDDCETVNEYKSKGLGDDCLLCKLFEILTEAAAAAADSSWSLFASNLTQVVGLAGAIYIALSTFKNLGSFSKQDIANYLTADKTGVFQILFKVAVIILLLRESTTDSLIINDIIKPILIGGMEIGLALTSEGSPVTMDSGVIAESGWSGVFASFHEFALAFNDSIYEIVAIGSSFLCNATRPPKFWDWYGIMLVYGLILYNFGWVLLIGVSFYLIDLVVRLALGAILLPFGIAAVISPQTSGYSKNIWNVFLNIFFNCVILGIVVGLTVQIIYFGMGRDTSGGGGVAGNEDPLSKFLSNLDANIDSNQVEAIANQLENSGSLMLIAVSFFVMYKLIEGLSKLVDSISDTGGLTSVASQVAGEAAKPLYDKAKQATSDAIGLNYKQGADGKYGYKIKKNSLLGASYIQANRTMNTLGRITRIGKFKDYVSDEVNKVKGTVTGRGKYGGRGWWRK